MRSDIRDLLVTMILSVLACTVVAAGITVLTALHDRSVCQDNGGTFYVTSTVFGCNY